MSIKLVGLEGRWFKSGSPHHTSNTPVINHQSIEEPICLPRVLRWVPAGLTRASGSSQEWSKAADLRSYEDKGSFEWDIRSRRSPWVQVPPPAPIPPRVKYPLRWSWSFIHRFNNSLHPSTRLDDISWGSNYIVDSDSLNRNRWQDNDYDHVS